jgi:hypothetical protein
MDALSRHGFSDHCILSRRGILISRRFSTNLAKYVQRSPAGGAGGVACLTAGHRAWRNPYSSVLPAL